MGFGGLRINISFHWALLGLRHTLGLLHEQLTLRTFHLTLCAISIKSKAIFAYSSLLGMNL
jgi:hypothetical protein